MKKTKVRAGLTAKGYCSEILLNSKWKVLTELREMRNGQKVRFTKVFASKEKVYDEARVRFGSIEIVQ